MLSTLSDIELGLAELRAEAAVALALECDDHEAAAFGDLDAVRAEREDRARRGVAFQRPDEAVEVALAPFGSAWDAEVAR
jgi:hypothetical protein